MPTLDTLKPLYLDLPSDARLSLIMAIRANRRISKRPTPAPKATKSKPTKKKQTLADLKEQLRVLFAGQPLDFCVGTLLDLDPTTTPEIALSILQELGVEI